MRKLPKHFMVSESDGGLYDTRVDGWHKNPPLRRLYSYTFRDITNVMQLKATMRNGPYTWPGVYPLALYTADGGTLCFDCVKQEFKQTVWSLRNNCDDGWLVVACDIEHGDEEGVLCDHCNEAIA